MFSELTGLRLCGIADDPFWPLPKNSSEELKNITEGILLNWKNNLDPEASGKDLQGTEVELWSYKSNKFKLIHTNQTEE